MGLYIPTIFMGLVQINQNCYDLVSWAIGEIPQKQHREPCTAAPCWAADRYRLSPRRIDPRTSRFLRNEKMVN